VTRFVLLVIVLIGVCAVVHGDERNEPFPIPPTYALVNDYHGFLTIRQTMTLNEKLHALEDKNGTQIVLLIVPTTGDTPMREYGERVFAQWDIGHNGDGNGVLFLISAQQGKVHLFTGPGISGAIPDIKLRHIYREQLEPNLQKQQWWDGINNTIDALIAAAQKEETAPGQYAQFFVISADALIAVAFASAGVLYLGYYGWRRYRQRKITRGDYRA
jgi:uncharacterized membrane protein YgcG